MEFMKTLEFHCYHNLQSLDYWCGKAKQTEEARVGKCQLCKRIWAGAMCKASSLHMLA